MVIFSIPCTSCSLPFKFHTNKTQLVCRASSTSFAAANPPTLTDNTTYFSGDLSLRTSWPPRMFSDKVLIKEDDDGLKINGSSEDEGFEKGVSNVITRLNTVVERMREMEMQKFMSRVKGEVISDRILAEEMSRDIFTKFLEKPLQYLSSDEGDFEEKLNHVNFLVRALEKSCTEAPNQRQ